jgi:hypothetical protein
MSTTETSPLRFRSRVHRDTTAGPTSSGFHPALELAKKAEYVSLCPHRQRKKRPSGTGTWENDSTCIPVGVMEWVEPQRQHGKPLPIPPGTSS